MPEQGFGSRSLARDPKLAIAAFYERRVDSSVDSVWENVFDWEHLPWLHSESFASIELRASGDWGWQAGVGFPGGGAAEIELVADRDAGCYVSRTLSGAGAPGEIWTSLDPLGTGSTDVHVEFLVAPQPPEILSQIGGAFRVLYERLWDQDAEMMQRRDGSRPTTASPSKGEGPVDLGDWEALAPRLPLVVSYAGRPFRIVESAGQVFAHSVECPHWRGPLGDCAVEDGVVTCPWHGYRFDVATGRSADDRGLRLRAAPAVEVDARSGRVRLMPPGARAAL